MKTRLAFRLFLMASVARAQSAGPLKLEEMIPLPDVQGRIDHLSIDVAGQRLFVSVLGNATEARLRDGR